MIAAGHVLVAEDRQARLVGVVAVQKLDCGDRFDLVQLFVDPGAIRTGIGRAGRCPRTERKPRPKVPSVCG